MTLRRSLAFAFATTLVLGTAACGGDDDVTVATPTTGAAAGDTVAVTAVDYKYEGLPATATAGTTFTLKNNSTAEAHELVALKLPDTETRSVDELMQLPQDQLQSLFAAQPATVIVSIPGAAGTPVVGDGTISEPGRYVFLCAIPVGVDPAEYMAAVAASQGGPPDIQGGPPHFTQGMYAQVTVT